MEPIQNFTLNYVNKQTLNHAHTPPEMTRYNKVIIEGSYPDNHQLLLNILCSPHNVFHIFEYVRRSRNLLDILLSMPDNMFKIATKRYLGIDLDDNESLIYSNQVPTATKFTKSFTATTTPGSHITWTIDPHVYTKWVTPMTPLDDYHGPNTCCGKYMALVNMSHSVHQPSTIHTHRYSKSSIFTYRQSKDIYEPHGGSISEWMTHNWMIFFEVFGYRVINGCVVQADKAHMDKFTRAIQGTRPINCIPTFDIGEGHFKIYNPATQSYFDSIFVPMLDYTIVQMNKYGMLLSNPDQSNLQSSNCNSLYIVKALVSHILPIDIRKKINVYCCTHQLEEVVVRKYSTSTLQISRVEHLINSGAVLDTNTLPFFNATRLSLSHKSLYPQNNKLANFFASLDQ